jgi:plasmid stabilization system protein ParE
MRGRIVPEMADDLVRELFVKSHRLIYEVRADKIVILAFLHGARRFPAGLL